VDRHWWVVSNPPHGDVDPARAGSLLDLATAEARIKVNFGAPEVWLAYDELDEAEDSVAALEGAGLRSVVIHAKDLPGVPDVLLAERFEFGEDALSASVDGERIPLAYEHALFAVLCVPPPDFGDDERSSLSAAHTGRSGVGKTSTGVLLDRVSGSSHLREQAAADTLERSAALDLYGGDPTAPVRISINTGHVSFAGLGDALKPRGRDNLEGCVELCRSRFSDLRLDARLVNVRPRRRLRVGGRSERGGDESRKLYSFGTVGLQDLLDAVSPELGEVSQYDLGSRLSYLLAAGG